MSNAPLNMVPSEPSLKDLLDLLKKDILLSLNAHHIGTIQSFNSAKQTATATINYPKTYYQLNSLSGLYNPVLVNYPLLVDCPLICLGGGTAALTFPIQSGDECLVLFNRQLVFGRSRGRAFKFQAPLLLRWTHPRWPSLAWESAHKLRRHPRRTPKRNNPYRSGPKPYQDCK